MDQIFFIGLLLFLLLNFVQDLRIRKVHVVSLLLIAVFSLILAGTTRVVLLNAFINLVFLGLVMALMTGYMTLRKKEFLNPFKAYFGLGDLLLYIAIAPLFLLRQFVVFFILSLVFSLVMRTVFSKNIPSDSIPLAGLTSILLVVVLLCDRFLPFPNFTLVV